VGRRGSASQGRTLVPYYRLYFLNTNGHFGRVEGFAAPDDGAAVTHAESAREPVKELWCGGRRLKQWKASAA
jgi:hypothetical protein